VVPIGKLEDVNRKEVSIEGRIEVLWESNSPAIAQVGLIEDESGQTKVTIWEKSNASWVEEGEQVRIHGQHGTGTTGGSQSPSLGGAP